MSLISLFAWSPRRAAIVLKLIQLLFGKNQTVADKGGLDVSSYIDVVFDGGYTEIEIFGGIGSAVKYLFVHWLFLSFRARSPARQVQYVVFAPLRATTNPVFAQMVQPPK